MIPLSLFLPEIRDYAGFIARDFAAATWRRTALFRRMYPRKFRLYCVGVGKSGTHSMAAIFGRYHAVHEAEFYQTVALAERVLAGESAEVIDRELLARDERLFLEVEASHLLTDFAPNLVRLFPDARFVMTIREPISWLESALNQTIRVSHRHRIGSTQAFFERRRGGVASAPEEAALTARGLASIEGWMAYYGGTYRRLLAAIPPDRLLVLRTPEIGKSLPELAAFAGVPLDSLKPQSAHSYRGVVKANLLSTLPPGYVKAIVEKQAGDLIQRYFPDAKGSGAG